MVCQSFSTNRRGAMPNFWNVSSAGAPPYGAQIEAKRKIRLRRRSCLVRRSNSKAARFDRPRRPGRWSPAPGGEKQGCVGFLSEMGLCGRACHHDQGSRFGERIGEGIRMVSTGHAARRATRSRSAVTGGMQTGEAADVSLDHCCRCARSLPAAQARVSGVGAHSDRGLLPCVAGGHATVR